MVTDTRLVDILHDLLSHVEAALGRGPIPEGTPPGGPLHELRQRIAELDPNAPEPTSPATRSVAELQTAAAAGDQAALEELVRRASAATPATS